MSVEGAGVSLAAGVISLFFSAIVVRSYAERRKPYNLMWGLGLVMFTLVMLIQLAAELGGWSDGLFKAWYVLGTSLVAFLGAGSVYIAHRRLGHAFAAYVVVLFFVFLAVAAITPANAGGIAEFNRGRPPSPCGWVGFQPDSNDCLPASSAPRSLSPLFTIPGSVTLIGIALYGLVRHRLKYNAYIAGGAVVLAVGTGLARFGISSLIYGAEFAGIALMFVGFWKAVEWAKEHRKTAAGGPPPTRATEEPRTTVETAPK